MRLREPGARISAAPLDQAGEPHAEPQARRDGGFIDDAEGAFARQHEADARKTQRDGSGRSARRAAAHNFQAE